VAKEDGRHQHGPRAAWVSTRPFQNGYAPTRMGARSITASSTQPATDNPRTVSFLTARLDVEPLPVCHYTNEGACPDPRELDVRDV